MAQSILVKSKEIRIKNTNMVVEDENRAEVVEFSILNAGTIEGVSDMAFYVQYRNKLDEVGMDVLVNAYPYETIHNDMLVLDWLPSATFSKERGKVEIQIVGFTRTLEPTEDTTYKSGKLYFDENGEFIPVYPATSTHSPKVGDAITGTVYENEITADDHRWSTEKCMLFLPENIYDNGTPVYTEAQVKSLITQIQAEIALAQGYATSAADSATAASGSASAASGSASSANTNALKAEGFAVGQQGGTDVTSGSPYYHNNAKYYSDEASASATAASASAGSASQSATTAVNAMIASVSETISPDDGGTNTITITYKDGTTKTFTVKNGKAGTPFEIYKTYASISAMNADFDNVPLMKMVCISSNTQDPDNGKLYVRGEEQFEFITDMSGAQGIQGPDGQAATIAVGTVSTGAAGSSATVINSGTSNAAVFDFSIPKGDTGASGAAATIAVGTVTAGDDPSDASVTNSGTSSAAVFDFVLPKGETGNTPLLSIGDVTYGDTPTVTIDTTDPDNPVLDFVLKTSEVGVVDNLTSDSQVDALSAKQGKVLKGLIDSANSRLDQHESRLQNLEQKAGDYTTVQYRGTNAVPTGKAKNGLVEKIVGKTRAWNQWVKNGNFADASEWSGTNFSISDGVCTITATGDNLYVYQNSDCYIQGHVYYCGFNIRNSAVIDRVRINTASRITGSASYYTENNIPSSTNWVKKGMILAVGEATYYDKIDIYVLATSGTVVEIKDLVLYDLTLIFGAGNEPSTVADALAQLPALGQYNAHDAGSLVDTVVSGVESRDTSDNLLGTLSLSEPVTLRSDDELTLETGAIVRKMVQIELSDYDFVYDTTRWRMASGTKKNNFIAMVKSFGSANVPNWICDRLVVAKGAKIINGEATYAIGQGSDKAMLVNNGSSETAPTGKLIVELDTPTTESVDPITDNFIEVEGGGTIDTIQEQTPVIDNSLDVGYLTL